MRFLLRLIPFKDESFYSYTLRLAKENLYESGKDIYRFVGIKYRKSHPSVLFRTATAKENILAMIGSPNISTNLQLIWQLTTGNDKRKHKVEAFGDIISSNYFVAYKVRVCPHCLVETGYMRNYWELYHVTVCPIHSCMLIDHCTTCGKAFGWHNGVLR